VSSGWRSLELGQYTHETLVDEPSDQRNTFRFYGLTSNRSLSSDSIYQFAERYFPVQPRNEVGHIRAEVAQQ